MMFVGVIASFQKSKAAGLNIGIASAIWSFVPIFVALIERAFFGVKIQLFQVLGMVFLVSMSILISLSDLFGPHAHETKLAELTTDTVPIYEAVLYSLIFPVSGTCMTFLIRYNNVVLKLDSIDTAHAFALIYSLIGTVACIVYFLNNEVTFSWKFLI